jgi:hypothetical protein
MKVHRKKKVTKEELIAIVCDACKVSYDDTVEMQEFLSFKNTGGYGSIFGDGYNIEIDLCQQCQKSLLGNYLRITRGWI